MQRREIEELLWREIDDDLSAADRERLETADRAEVDEIRQSLAALTGLLERADEIPPPELGHRVRSGLAERSTPAPGVLESLRAALAVRWPARLAYASVGLLVGVLGVALWRGAEVDRAALVGTVGAAPLETAAPFVRESSPAPGLVVALPPEIGRLTLRRSGERLSLELELETAQPISIVLERTGVLFEARGVSGGPGRTLAPLRSMDFGAGRAEIRAAGPGAVELRLFAGAFEGASMQMRVASGDRQLVTLDVDLAELP